MGCCGGWHHGPWCGGPPWWYGQTPIGPPVSRRRLRREDLEEYLDYLEEELKRVRDELAEAKATP
jgi:hypothetical protein